MRAGPGAEPEETARPGAGPAAPGRSGATGVPSGDRGAGSSLGLPAQTKGEAASCGVARRIVRLNDDQFARAVADLLPGVTVGAIRTPGRDRYALFTEVDRLGIDGRLTAQIEQAAAGVAAQVAKGVDLAVTCKAGEDPRECARGFIDRFVPRAYRRQLTVPERDALLALFDLGRQEDFGTGIATIVEATLQSAGFLYRTELGADERGAGLTAYEMASALSFFLLDSVPDEPLWTTAHDGSLLMPGKLEAQVDRLLALPRVRERLLEVMGRWFRINDALAAKAEVAGFDDPLRRSMHEDVKRFLRSLLAADGTLGDLFGSRQAFPDAAMTKVYGLPSGRSDQAQTLDANRWSGILTRPGVVAGLPSGNRTVFRGLFVRTRILCGVLSEPQPGTDVTVSGTITERSTEREKVAVRARTSPCGACHGLMDPLGLALEHYDEIGRYVTAREGTPVDASGTLTGTDDVDGPFSNAVDLSKRLGGSSTVAACALAHLAAAAMVRAPDQEVDCQRATLPRLKGSLKLNDIVRLVATRAALRERPATGASP